MFLKLLVSFAFVLFASLPAYAVQFNYPVITDLDITECGQGALVIVSGTATFENDQVCVRIYKQYEGQGFFQWVAQNCNSPANWSFNLTLDPNVWKVRIRVDTLEGFNKAQTDSIWFTVPTCTCP